LKYAEYDLSDADQEEVSEDLSTHDDQLTSIYMKYAF